MPAPDSLILDRYETDRRDSGLGYPFPWGETIVEHYHSSRALHKILQAAVSRATTDVLGPRREAVAVLAIGSTGRFDGKCGTSDIDLVVCFEDAVKDQIDLGVKLYEHLARQNHCLILDHRRVLEEGRLAELPTRETSYPILSRRDLTVAGETMRNRRMQTLFEATPIYNEHMWSAMCADICKHYRMDVDLPTMFPSAEFRADFEAFADGMWKAIVQYEGQRGPPRNQKIAKALFLREWLSRMDALAVAMAAFMKVTIKSHDDLIVYLSAPPYIKCGSWIGDRFGRWFAKQLSESSRAAIVSAIRNGGVERVFPAGDLRRCLDAGDLDGTVRQVCMGVLRTYDRLLQYLYSDTLVQQINSLGSDYPTWMAKPELRDLRAVADAANASVMMLAKTADIVFTHAATEDAMQFPYGGSRLESWITWARDWKAIRL